MSKLRLVTRLKNRGFTIAEFVIVFLIFLVIAASAYSPLKGLMINWRVNKMADDTTIAVQRIQSAFSNAADYANLSTNVVADGGYMEPRYVDNNFGMRTLWNTPMTFAASTDESQGIITMTGLGQDYCMAVVERFTSMDIFEQVNIGSTALIDGDGTPIVANFSRCSANATVSMVFGRM